MLQPNATVHFPNVTSPTIPQRLTNVLLKKSQPRLQTYHVFPQYTYNNNDIMQSNMIHTFNFGFILQCILSQVNILKGVFYCILKSFRP